MNNSHAFKKKSTFPVKTKLEKVANVDANPFLFLETPCLYVMPTIYRFWEKTLSNVLLFVINVGYEDMKIGKGYT